MIDIAVLNRLNAPTRAERLENLRTLLSGTAFPEAVPQYVNNHIHTTYSFSPYSPAAAVYAARLEGLCTAGIVDHDSIAGAREFLEAAELAGLPATIGMECRVDMRGTRLEGRRTNNPDQVGISYMTIQSVPHGKIDFLDQFFAPRREARNRRNRKMVENINRLLPDAALDFEKDVLPLSQWREGGSVTERHLMYALAKRLMGQTGKGPGLTARLEKMGLELSEKQRTALLDTEYPFYEYGLLGILKSAFVPKIYIDAGEECPQLAEVVRLCREADACLCYAYLGDVGESVTGDKKAQRFEDAYLEELFQCLREEGVWAVTYMPARNTPGQLERLRGLCREYGMFQVSGEDINSPRQSFAIRAMENPLFQNLIDAAWRLIDHEKSGGPLRG